MPHFLTTITRWNQFRAQQLSRVSPKPRFGIVDGYYNRNTRATIYITTIKTTIIPNDNPPNNRFSTEAKSYSKYSFYTRPVSQVSLTTVSAALAQDKDDEHDHYVSPFHQISGKTIENTAAAVLYLRQRKHRMEKSSLDLELGEGIEKKSRWTDEEDHDYEDESDDWIFDNSYDYLSSGNVNVAMGQPSSSFGEKNISNFSDNTFPHHSNRNTVQLADETDGRGNESTQWSLPYVEDAFETFSSRSLEENQTKIFPSTQDCSKEYGSSFAKQFNAIEYMKWFDPVRPPPPSNLEELQIWLECEMQQETVLRFQKAIDDARDRKDYASLSAVQKQIVRWFEPLKQEISSRQRAYVLKETDENLTYEGSNRYGPLLCALSPAKLAVIAAHEAIIFTLLKSPNGRNGVAFAALAKRLGDAVEDEVVIHRLLHKRFKESQLRTKSFGLPDSMTDVEPLDEKCFETPTENDFENDDIQGNKTSKIREWTYTSSHLQSYLDEISKLQPSAKKRRVIRYAIRRARDVLDKDEEWPIEDKVQLGAALFEILLKTATVIADAETEMAFTYEKRWTKKDKTQSFVSLNERIYNMFVNDKLNSFTVLATRFKPMIVPPKPWMKLDEGGYRMLQADLLRFHGCNIQKEVLSLANLSIVFDGLNALGSIKWKVNKKILHIAKECWNLNIPLGDIPTRTDFDLPPEPIRPDLPRCLLDKSSESYKAYKEKHQEYLLALARYNRIKQKNMDLRSLRCSAILKLDQAEKFQDFEQIYFPYNMDFRGRAYPIPPHLSNIGSDLCRGILCFAEAKPLGERGFYWLKVHLANFAGKDKLSFDERAQFVDNNLEQLRDSVMNPFGGQRWWMSLEDPFQGLATCHEIISAIDSGDPTTYRCSLPVHMDGSCNGLQHYAALGRDLIGGKAVNLCATNEPQDVYVGVMHEVVKRVAKEAERELEFDVSDATNLNTQQKKDLYNNRSAKLVNGLIDRGVVKRTVMTSVYGVTFIGARQQIQEKIEDKLESQGIDVFDKNTEIFHACGYLAKVTMETIGDLFSGAKGTMNWLTQCARLITQHGYPVAWISPIGLPAIQPYRQKKSATLVTLLQTVTLTSESDDLPIHKQRQVSAFPPNYIHSLDSSHMLLTALAMHRRGLTFSAVHDSFWTHPCDVDEMNSVLRNVFIDLYNQPLLEKQREIWQMRYPDLEFPPLPDKGQLDLDEVKRAPYFFQ